MADSVFFTNGGIPIQYVEHCAAGGGSLQESYEADRMTATRVFDVKKAVGQFAPGLGTGWAHRWNFIRSHFGYSELVTLENANLPGGTVTYLSRKAPVPYPALTTPWRRPMLWPKDVVSVTGITPLEARIDPDLGQMVGWYDQARVMIRYESRPYAIRPDTNVGARLVAGLDGGNFVIPDEATLTRYVERSWNYVSQALTLPRGAYLWHNTTIPVDDSNVRIVSHTEITYVWYQIPGVPAVIPDLLGRVNETEFDNQPPETMLLTGVELRPYRWLTGQRYYDVKYKFRYFQPEANKGHNHFLRYTGATNTPVYTRIVTPGTPPGGATGIEGVFKLGNMHDLFRPPLVDLLRDW